MTFSLLILAVFGTIVFVHYIQGFFSSAISAILTVIAAVVAFSYHESLVPLFGGHAADFADGICLLLLFAITYIILRVAFDSMIPGNIRLPLIAEKVGAGVMGIVAAIFASGVLAIGAQEMPFNADIAGFARYDVNPKRQVRVEQKGRQMYSETWDELTATAPATPGSDEHGVSILPVDNIVISLIEKLSAPTGSLQNGRPLYAVHPDFLGETFDQRLGIEAGGAHIAVNAPGVDSVRVMGLFSVNPKVPQADGEVPGMRASPLKLVAVPPNQMLLAVRIVFGSAASDKDTFVRFSPGSCRLMLHDPQGDDPENFQDLYPVGTMEGVNKLLLNKLDDFLLCGQGKGADVVYLVPKKLFDKSGPQGSFVEIKRWARVSLAGMKVEPTLTESPEISMMRKPAVVPEGSTSSGAAAASAAPQPTQVNPHAVPPAGSSGAAAPSVAGGTEFAVETVGQSNLLTAPLGIPVKDGTDTQQVPGGGYVKLGPSRDIKTSVMDAAVSELNDPKKIGQFSVPEGSAMVEVSGKVPASAPWAFATEPEQYELVDSQGKHYPPNGIFATYKASTGEHVLLRYIDATGISGSAAPEGNPPPPTQVTFLFVVPTGVTINAFDDHGKKVRDVNITTKK